MITLRDGLIFPPRLIMQNSELQITTYQYIAGVVVYGPTASGEICGTITHIGGTNQVWFTIIGPNITNAQVLDLRPITTPGATGRLTLSTITETGRVNLRAGWELYYSTRMWGGTLAFYAGSRITTPQNAAELRTTISTRRSRLSLCYVCGSSSDWKILPRVFIH